MLRWRFQRKLASVLVFGCLTFIFASANLVFAVDGDIEVEVGIMPILTITAPSNVRIVLEPGGAASVAEMPVKIVTNNQTGLHASVSLDKISNGSDDTLLRSLVNEYDSNYYLEPLSESIVDINDFPFDQWGCTFEDDMRYQALNTADKPSVSYLTHNVTANEKRYLLCAARASKFQVAGLYSNTIMMTAVPNVVPDTISAITYMQEINETVIASMAINQYYQLVDGRDKKIYWVTKLSDGHVYMAQNLDYDLAAKTDGSELNEWGNLYPENPETAYDESRSKLYKDGGNLIYDVDNDTYIDSGTVAFNSEKLRYHIGSFYNIEASYRGVDENGGNGDVTFFDASGYCPFSWTVPGSLSTSRLFGEDFMVDLNSVYYSDLVSRLYLAPMGYLDTNGNHTGVGQKSYYLGGAKVSTSRLPGYETVFDSRNALTVNSDYSSSYNAFPDTAGGFIRCVAVPGRRYVIAYKNAEQSIELDGGAKPEFEQAILPNDINVTTYDTKYSVDMNSFVPTNIPEGYEFLGWTTDENTRSKANVDSTLNLGSTQEVIRASDTGNNEVELTLYPAWQHNYTEEVVPVIYTPTDTRTLDDIEYMQDINGDIVVNTEYNTIRQLIDARDNKKYWVRKLADGNLWMEQNLDLSFGTEITLTPEDSNVSSSVTLANGDGSTGQVYIEGGKNLSASDVLILPDDSMSWRNVHGSLYNKYTILAGSENTSNTTGDYTDSICPKGWELPSATGTSDVFYRDNYNEMSNYTFSGQFIATSTPQVGGGGDSSQIALVSHTYNINDEGYNYGGNYGNYWSNTEIRGTNRESASSNAHVLSIPGVSELYVTVYSGGESCCDSLYIWAGSYPGYSTSSYSYSPFASFNMGSSNNPGYYTLGGNSIYLNRWTFVIPGDSVTFAFSSDGSVNGYGYFAVVSNVENVDLASATSNLDLTSQVTDGLIAFSEFGQSSYNYSSENLSVRCVAKKSQTNKTLKNITKMQEMRPSICANTTVGTEVQLTDTRDGQTYFVRKMSDGNCWMVQNLALGKVSSSLSLSSLDTDYLDKNTFGLSLRATETNTSQLRPTYGISNDVVTIEYGYPFAHIEDIPMNSYFRKFYSGVYYNYAAANANNQTIGSLCPRGWRLPKTSDGFIPNESFAREELNQVYTGGEVVDFGEPVYLTSTIDDETHKAYISTGYAIDDDDVNFYPVRCLAR